MTAPPPLRMTRHTRTVLATLADQPGLCGIDVTRRTGIVAGTLYPLLERLETHGLATSEWEDPADTDPGTPRRRFYTLTEAGRAKAKEIST